MHEFRFFKSTYDRAPIATAIDFQTLIDQVMNGVAAGQRENKTVVHMACDRQADMFLKMVCKPQFMTKCADKGTYIMGIPLVLNSHVPDNKIVLMNKDNEVLYVIDTGGKNESVIPVCHATTEEDQPDHAR